jgi:hypothetical protein
MVFGGADSSVPAEQSAELRQRDTPSVVPWVKTGRLSKSDLRINEYTP